MAEIIDIVQSVTGPLNSSALQNAQSVVVALEKYGKVSGLLVPHRLAQFLPQILHESGNFRYDKEVWGPTPAQKRYDTRTDLGNTAAVDGDGFLYRGRAGIQITGKANYAAFRDWCRANISADAPDFGANPDAVLTDPWEGLAPIWYWSTRNLNKYADSGNPEMIRRRINGGTNGLAECLDLYTKVALVMLGFKPGDVREFQSGAKGDGLYKGEVDGLDGPQTRSALHMALSKLSGVKVTAAPVVETKVEAVTPPALDKPLTQTAGFWERIIQIGGLGSIASLSAFFQEWQVVLVICGFLLVGSIVGLILHKQIVDAVKSVKDALQ